jgi:hypothetical protein
MQDHLNYINASPRMVAILGSVSGWATLDFLHAAQFLAALLAGLVSLCALILTAPKAWREFKSWF